MNAHVDIQQFKKMLHGLDAWIEEAIAHAKTKGFDPEIFVQLRLSPDMYPFVKQVQSACDTAKFAAAYLAGVKAPAHPDTETSLAELRARITTATTYLESFAPEAFQGAADRRVAPAWLGGKWLAAGDYLTQVATPNFYFHLTTAYDILRHAGVLLGKMAFIGAMPVHDP